MEKCDLCNLVQTTSPQVISEELNLQQSHYFSGVQRFLQVVNLMKSCEILCNTQCVSVFCGQCLVSHSGRSDFHTRNLASGKYCTRALLTSSHQRVTFECFFYLNVIHYITFNVIHQLSFVRIKTKIQNIISEN